MVDPKVTDFDSTDLGLTRKTRKVKAEKADLLDNFIATISITTYLGDIITDCLVAHHYYVEKHYSWFTLTVIFIVIPSLVIQFLSCKWYHDDNGGQTWLSIILHILQLGPVERYCIAFWSGLKTLCVPESRKENFHSYISNWRDVTMLRLFEAFIESAPQVVLQLYILINVYPDVTWKNDWITICAAVLSIVSLAWSIVSYSHALRISTREKGYSVLGYTFQVAYRLFMVASRIVTLVLFACQFKWIVLVVCLVHWIIMFYWLHFQRSAFCQSENDCCRSLLDCLFVVLMAFVHIFCFINTQEGTSRQRVSAYYTLMFIENSVMIAFWYPFRTEEFGFLEYFALSFVWGGFFLGVICMLIFYKLFHPTQGIVEGWLCCVICGTKEDKDELEVPHGLTPKPTPTSARHHVLIQKSDKYIPVDIELSARSDTSGASKHHPVTEDIIIPEQLKTSRSNSVGSPANWLVSIEPNSNVNKNYGSTSSITLNDASPTHFI